MEIVLKSFAAEASEDAQAVRWLMESDQGEKFEVVMPALFFLEVAREMQRLGVAIAQHRRH